MKKHLLLIFIFLSSIQLFAQLDKTFWFAVPEVTELHADRPILLQLAANDKESTVIVSVPANPNFTPLEIVLEPNTLETIDLSEFIDVLENRAPDSITNKGLLIEASEKITAYYEVRGTSGGSVNNTDIFALKGENALGMNFYLPFQNQLDNNHSYYGRDGWSSADIVATEDNTIIEITPTENAVGHPKGETFSITLQKGQTYSLRADGQYSADHLVGTKITSNKNIAVTIKDDSIVENYGFHQHRTASDDIETEVKFVKPHPVDWYPASDLVGDQLIPVRVIGTKYILAEGIVYVLATEDSTEIQVKGEVVVTLNEGEQKPIYLTEEPTYIESSKPVYALHVIEQNQEYGGAIVPPIQCTGSRKVSFVRPFSDGFELTVLIKSGGEDGFYVNGKKSTSLVASNFNEVPNTNGEWLYARRDLFELEEGKANFIENKGREFHLGINSRTTGGSFYGYFSNFGNLDLGVDVVACQGDDVEISAGEGRDTYLWSTGETTSSIEIPSEEEIKDSIIWVKVTEGRCVAEDTVLVSVGEAVRDVELIEEIELCEQDSLLIELPERYTYSWNTGDTTASYVVQKNGWHIVEATSKDGCTLIDSLLAGVVPLPVVDLGNDTLICEDAELTIRLAEGYNVYDWNNGTSSNVLSISEPGTYDVYVMTRTSEKICGTDEDAITVDYWEVETYNVLTPNGDGVNDVFVAEGIEDGGNWTLDVYNRWGKHVYHKEQYDNTWTGEDLIEGTYYFNLNEKENASCNQFNSWIQIIR